MKRTALIPVVIALALAAASAAPATADERVTDPEIAGYVATARAYWQADPVQCAGDVWIIRLAVPAEPGAWARSALGGCTIALDPDHYPAPPNLPAGYWPAAMCTVIAHEYGHLLGVEHSTDPASLMFPAVPINVVPGCPVYHPPARLVQLHRRRDTQVTRRHGQRRVDVVDRAVRPGRRIVA